MSQEKSVTEDSNHWDVKHFAGNSYGGEGKLEIRPAGIDANSSGL